MQLNVPTVQVNLDFSSEVDMVHKFRVKISLQPITKHFCKFNTEGRP
jgi:gamma-glutamylcysteine synthetase